MDDATLSKFLADNQATIAGFASELASLRERIKPDRRRWGSIAQAATYTGISSTGIRRLLSSGKLTAHRPLGGRVVISFDELDSVISTATSTPRKRRGVRA